MRSIVFFNNKGGVGKTTLACNVVSYMNQHMGLRALLIDADPQCNATQAILSEEACAELYMGTRSGQNTLFDYLAPIESGESGIATPVEPLLGTHNNFLTDIIPGHPKISFVEDRLSAAWSDLGKGSASLRTTNWCSQLFAQIESRYDLVFFDVGPSLGALNRTVILSSDYLVTPFGCDIFSLLGIQNISSWINTWGKQYRRSIQTYRDDRPDLLSEYPVVLNLDEKFRFAGYSVQQYVARSFKTGKRPVKAYETIKRDIPSVVNANLPHLRPTVQSHGDVELGDIPFMYSLVPLAQAARSPIHSLDKTRRLVGSQYQQVEEYKELMDRLCSKLLRNIGLR